MDVTALIPAAGMGSRMGTGTKKQYIGIGDRPILFYTLLRIERCEWIREIILAIPEADLTFVATEIVDRFGFQKVKKIVSGGAERQDSVRAAFQAMDGRPDLIMIHDGVRPFVTEDILQRSIQVAFEEGASVVGIPAAATMKRISNGRVQATLARSELWEIQTPQTFRTDWFRQAIEKSLADGFRATDDAALLEHAGFPVYVVEGSSLNLKITRPEDLRLAECLLKEVETARNFDRQGETR